MHRTQIVSYLNTRLAICPPAFPLRKKTSKCDLRMPPSGKSLRNPAKDK